MRIGSEHLEGYTGQGTGQGELAGVEGRLQDTSAPGDPVGDNAPETGSQSGEAGAEEHGGGIDDGE